MRKKKQIRHKTYQNFLLSTDKLPNFGNARCLPAGHLEVACKRKTPLKVK
jgi:hypothetical protein